MTFISMVFAFLFLVIVVLAVIGLAGVTVTVISVIRRKKAVRQGMQPRKAGLIVGIVLMSIPVLVIAGTVLLFAFGGRNSSYRRAVSDRDALYAGIREKDAGVIYEVFSPYTKDQNAISYEDIDGMLAFIEGNVVSFHELLPSEYCEQYGADGRFEIQNYHGEIWDIVTDTEKTYEIYYFGYSQYDGDENRLGLEQITVRSDDEILEIGIGTEEKP